MSFSYKPLWKLLIDMDMTKKELMENYPVNIWHENGYCLHTTAGTMAEKFPNGVYNLITKEHFYEALTEGGADAALAASLFHYKELEIREVKEYLRDRGIPVRL